MAKKGGLGIFSWFTNSRKRSKQDSLGHKKNSCEDQNSLSTDSIDSCIDSSINTSELSQELFSIVDTQNAESNTTTPTSMQPQEDTKSHESVSENEIAHKVPVTLLARLAQGLRKTKQALGLHYLGKLINDPLDKSTIEVLEDNLLMADVGVSTCDKIIAQLKQEWQHAPSSQEKNVPALLKNLLIKMLYKVEQPLRIDSDSKALPFVILMVGVNGAGKTTTIGKLGYQLQQEGRSVMFAAGDTFRAAAVEQLQIWGERYQIPVIAQQGDADSAAVIFDALQSAKARNIDVLIADTAGRLQNKSHLMTSLQKIIRVIKKLNPSAPHEIMLTVDANTGQNVISQVRLFNEFVGISGISLSKLDGTAKGGIIFTLAEEFGVPIRFIGVGEQANDLHTFNATDFVNALLAPDL